MIELDVFSIPLFVMIWLIVFWYVTYGSDDNDKED